VNARDIMNIFRLTGDLSHLVAVIVLLAKIWKTRSCSGECFINLVVVQCYCCAAIDFLMKLMFLSLYFRHIRQKSNIVHLSIHHQIS